MKKLISMLVVMTTLVSSLATTAFAATEEDLTAFKNAKVASLNKDFTNKSDILKDKDGNSLTLFTSQNLSSDQKGTAKNVNNEDYSYLNFTTPGSQTFSVQGDMVDKEKTTVEMWINLDSYTWEENKANNNILFFSGNQGNDDWTQNGTLHTSAVWMLMVQNGNLRQYYRKASDNGSGEIFANALKGEVVDAGSITSYKNKFVHVVATRIVDKVSKKIIYKTYINGELKATAEDTTLASLDDIANFKPDTRSYQNGVFTFMGSNTTGHVNTGFYGKIGDLNVYNAEMTDDIAKARYDETKNTYKEPLTTENFKKTKNLYLNKDYTSLWNRVLGTAGKDDGGSWPGSGAETEYVSAVGVNENTFKYFDYTGSADQSLMYTGGTRKTAVINNQHATVEFWLSIDDILKNDTKYANLFFTTLNSDGTAKYAERKWNLFVKSGKLVHQYTADDGSFVTVGETDLKSYKKTFVHIMLTREVNEEDKTITYKTYFNGELKATATQSNVSADRLAYPDTLKDGGGTVAFMGGYQDGGAYFKGKLTELNVYNEIATDTIASEMYNEYKDIYKLPAPVRPEGFEGEKVMYFDKEATALTSLLVDAEENKPVSVSTNTNNGYTDKLMPTKITSANDDGDFTYLEYTKPGHSLIWTSYDDALDNEATTVDMWINVSEYDWDPNSDHPCNNQVLFFTTNSDKYNQQGHATWILRIASGVLQQRYKEATKTAPADEDNEKYLAVGDGIDIRKYKGQFIHVAATRIVDKENQKITYRTYLNGQKVEEKVDESALGIADCVTFTNPDSRSTGKAYMQFMGSGNMYTGFYGKVGEVNVYSAEMTDAEALKQYEKGKDVYKFGIDSFKNVTLNKTNSVLENSVSAFNEAESTNKGFPQVVIGKNAKKEEVRYVDFSGKNGQYIKGSSPVVNKEKTTIEAWVKADSLAQGTIFKTMSGETEGWKLYISGNSLSQSYKGTSCGSVSLGDYAGKFVHVIATRELGDNAVFKIYLNGELKQTASAQADILSPDGENAEFYVGADGFDGGFAEFNVYSDVISDKKAKSKYDDGKEKYTLDNTLSVGSVVFFNGEYADIESLSEIDESKKLTVEVNFANNESKTKKIGIYFAVYQGTTLTAVKFAETSDSVDANKKAYKYAELDLSEVEITSDTKAQVLVWDGETKPENEDDILKVSLSYSK